MDAEKVLPLALGAGVVLAVIMAKSGKGGGSAPTVVQLGPTTPDPALQEAVTQSGETARAKLAAMGQIAAATVGLASKEAEVSGQNRIARLAAWRDVNVTRIGAQEATKSNVAIAAIQSGRDVAVANAETNRDNIQAGYNFRSNVANAQRDTMAGYYGSDTARTNAWADVVKAKVGANASVASAQISAGRDLGIAGIERERDAAIAREQTRQETIRANAQASSAALQANTQAAIAKAQERGDTTRSIISGVTSVAGTAIGAIFGPAGAAAGGWFGNRLGRLF